MNIFGIRGGAKVSGRKELTAETPVEKLPMPRLLHVPLQQHVGSPAVPIVTVVRFRRRSMPRHRVSLRELETISHPIRPDCPS